MFRTGGLEQVPDILHIGSADIVRVEVQLSPDGSRSSLTTINCQPHCRIFFLKSVQNCFIFISLYLSFTALLVHMFRTGGLEQVPDILHIGSADIVRVEVQLSPDWSRSSV